MQILKKRKKDNLFWFLLVPTFVLLALTISLSPWFLEMISTPPDRFFSGINRFSNDYFIYLSYVEMGRRGEILAKLLIETIPQSGIFAHTVHTLAGFVLGHIIGLSAVTSYHLTRAFWGLVFLISTIIFFLCISKSKKTALLAFFLTFFISGFAKITSLKPLTISLYLDWLQEQNIIGRATGPIHYNAGFVFFILAVIWFFFFPRIKPAVKALVMGILLNLILNANPFAFLILALVFGLYVVIKFLLLKRERRQLPEEVFLLFFGFLTTVPLFIYNQKFLSVPPWGKYGMSPKFYVINHPPLPFLDTILSVGPIFFLGTAEIICIVFRKKINSLNLFFIVWILCQFILFFFGDYLKIHPLRAFSGLYYLPLTYFSALFIQRFFKEKVIFVSIILFLITFPGYFAAYKQQLFAFTDFKNYSLFTFPSRRQGGAFMFMEKNLGIGDGVLALFEESSLIPALTACSTNLDMPYEEKVRFYKAGMTINEAKNFLKINHFKYVYLGYQEKYYGRELETKYSFLKTIFQNSEVQIFSVVLR